MEIVYLWIRDYKIFQKAGFNFSSKYFFNFIYKENSTCTLYIENNPNYVNNFFENENISNITAIVGKNGTGKTTVLDFIKEYFPEGNFNGLKNDENRIEFILILKSIDELKSCEIYKLIVNIKEEIKFIDKSNLNLKGNTIDVKNIQNLGDVSFIFYSNIFDMKRETSEWGGLFNISTNCLVKEDKGIRLLDSDSSASEIDIHNLYEILRNLEFIFNFRKKELPFKIPDLLSIEPTNFDELYLFRKKDNDWNAEKLKYLFLLINKIRTVKKLKNEKERFINQLYESVLFNIIRTYEVGENYNILIDLFDKCVNINSNNVYFSYFEMLSKEKPKFQDYNIRASNILKFFDFIIQYINNRDVKFIDNLIYIPIKGSKDEKIIELISLYLDSLLLNSYLKFNWKIIENKELRNRNLSTGEQSLLTLYSRFYNVINYFGIKNNDLKENLIMLVDEGDLYFHPEWQREYFNNFLDLIKIIFEKHKLQIIFATNSPFLVSDLPKSHIIYLDKNKTNEIEILSSNNVKEETFASNIHTLLSSSFFMNSLMSEFAKSKINKIITIINSEEINLYDENKINELKKNINLIGEKILKDKLMQMLEFKINPFYKDFVKSLII